MNYDKNLSFLLSLYCLLLPFEEILAFSFGSVNKIVGAIIIIHVLVNYHWNMYLTKTTIRLLLWVLYMLVSIVWSDSYSWWLYFFQLYLVQSVFFCAISFVPSERINIDWINNSLILAGLFAASILILSPKISMFTEEGRRTIILFGNTFDPNIVATIFIISIFIALSKLYTMQIFMRRVLLFIVIGIIVTGLLLTGSRGALISFLVSFAFMIVIKTKDKKQRRRNLLILFGSIVVLYLLLRFLPDNLLISRFSAKNILGFNEYNAQVHNRYTIWQYGIKLFVLKPIIGYGCGNFFPALGTVYREAASHNLFLLLLVEGGVFGFFIFCSFLFCIVQRLVQKGNIDNIIIFIAIMIMAFTLDSITYKYFWFVLIYFLIDNCTN